jgi:hypothetical protein
VEKRFRLTEDFLLEIEHEALPNGKTIELEFVHALRSTGILRDDAHHDTYDGHGAFSSNASEILLQRTSMRNHPAFRGRENYLAMTDQERLGME